MLAADSPEFAAALGDWLRDRLDDARSVRVHTVTPPRSGFSAETLMIDTTVTGSAGERPEKLVLRRESTEPAVYPVQAPELDPANEIEIEVQWRSMGAIAEHSRVPIAPLVGFERRDEVLGAPFFVMGHVAGEVPIESPIYTAEGMFFDATPADRGRMVDNGLALLADMHRIDWRAAGFEWLDVAGDPAGSARQLRLWHEYAMRELDGRRHPLMERGYEWLSSNLPATQPVGVAWGDGRLGNIIWRDFTPACATDFEAISLAPPEHDLGWWLLFDRWSHEAMDMPRLDGEPTREEQRDRYCQHAGRDLGDVTWHETFAAYRYSAIVVRVMNRTVARGQMPADNTYWLENHATACLAMLLPD